MFQTLPKDYKELYEWDWAKFEPYARDLAERPINAANVEEWLKDWTSLDQCYDEVYNRLYVATTINTADKESEERYVHFMDELYPKAMEAGQVLKEKLLESGLQPAGFEVPLRNMRAEADLFRKENLPLFSEETKLTSEYDKIIGSQTVLWDGEERTVSQVKAVSIDPDRTRREKAYRLVAERQLADRDALNTLWGKFLDLRANMTKNAGKPDYRSFRWQQLLRFDYQPKDCVSFHKAIEEAVVPAAKRIYERRRQQLGLTTLRPWDLDVDATGQPPLKPYQTIDELKNKTLSVFKHVDPKLGEYFETMMSEGLLDLDNRKNKAPGGYCTAFGRVQRPFIFANAVGLQDDVMTLVHEGGHSFHVFESAHLPYNQQLAVGMEFAEVASMGMELLASPYFAEEFGGYYSAKDAARARIENLERSIRFWPYMAVVDAFQHWVYENPALSSDPKHCDQTWISLWERFMGGVDYSGLEDVVATGWHRKPHIFEVPFYYVEYGLAQLGAVQVWRNALKDQAKAVANYRKALSLGGSVTLPQLYEAAGAKLAFDVETLKESVELMESQIALLEKVS